jgi:hypothetical protein
VVVVVVFLTDNNTTPTKVVLSCFGLLVGLWQYNNANCGGKTQDLMLISRGIWSFYLPSCFKMGSQARIYSNIE